MFAKPSLLGRKPIQGQKCLRVFNVGINSQQSIWTRPCLLFMLLLLKWSTFNWWKEGESKKRQQVDLLLCKIFLLLIKFYLVCCSGQLTWGKAEFGPVEAQSANLSHHYHHMSFHHESYQSFALPFICTTIMSLINHLSYHHESYQPFALPIYVILS